MKTVWPGVTVSDESLAQCISEVRRALGKGGARIVRTVPRRGYVIERDDSQGDLAGLKRLYAVDLGPPGSVVSKRLAADLLRIDDPALLSLPGAPGDVGLGPRFALPFWTIEGIVVEGPDEVLVLVDNNFPFSCGRHVGSGAPDDTEIVRLRLASPVTRQGLPAEARDTKP